MSETLTSNGTTDEAELKAAIKKLFVEIEREHEKMKDEQKEIDRLKARTRATLARLEAA